MRENILSNNPCIFRNKFVRTVVLSRVSSFLSSDVTFTVAKRTAPWRAEGHRPAFSASGGAKKGCQLKANLSYSIAEPSLKRLCFFIVFSITWYKSPRRGQKEKMAVRTPVALNTLDLTQSGTSRSWGQSGGRVPVARSAEHGSRKPCAVAVHAARTLTGLHAFIVVIHHGFIVGLVDGSSEALIAAPSSNDPRPWAVEGDVPVQGHLGHSGLQAFKGAGLLQTQGRSYISTGGALEGQNNTGLVSAKRQSQIQ